MSIVNIIAMLGVFIVIHLLIHRACPILMVRIGRAMGFKMQMTPLTSRRVKRFKKIRRGYWSFKIITTFYVISLILEVFVNHKPLFISYEGHKQIPAVVDMFNFWIPFYEGQDEARWRDFGLDREGEINGRKLSSWVSDPEKLSAEMDRLRQSITEDTRNFHATMKSNAEKQGMTYDDNTPLPDWKIREHDGIKKQIQDLNAYKSEIEAGKVRIFMPPYPYSASELLLDISGTPPHKPFQKGRPILGTDYAGRDVLAQLLYGFRISFSFALLVAFIGYAIGIVVGGIMGYFGGWIDILVQRGIEVWSSIPFLFTLMIIASVVQPSFWVLALMLVLLRAWLGITYTVRGEFYREKSRDYVQAVRAIGFGDWKIMLKHILPNSMVPIVTFLPFEIVAYISSLVSLDYLGFGLPPEVPSWGRLLNQGANNIVNHPHLVLIPVIAFALTLFFVVMIGEAVREAFDPKEYARLR